MSKGCLYKDNDNYYLISSIAFDKILAFEFKTFKQFSIEIEKFDYKLIDYTPDNIKELLDNYEEFKACDNKHNDIVKGIAIAYDSLIKVFEKATDNTIQKEESEIDAFI